MLIYRTLSWAIFLFREIVFLYSHMVEFFSQMVMFACPATMTVVDYINFIVSL
jgi:hypothetical protein